MHQLNTSLLVLYLEIAIRLQRFLLCLLELPLWKFCVVVGSDKDDVQVQEWWRKGRGGRGHPDHKSAPSFCTVLFAALSIMRRENRPSPVALLERSSTP